MMVTSDKQMLMNGDGAMDMYVVITRENKEIHSPICRDLRHRTGEIKPRVTYRATIAAVLSEIGNAKVMPCIK